MTKCNRCYATKDLCGQCIDNPKYADIPKVSKFQDYPICCPYGRTDCINDPGYEYVFHNENYKRWNGDIPYTQIECYYSRACGCGEYYDGEDK